MLGPVPWEYVRAVESVNLISSSASCRYHASEAGFATPWLIHQAYIAGKSLDDPNVGAELIGLVARAARG